MYSLPQMSLKSAVVSATLALSGAAAQADALSIAPTQASLAFLPGLISALSNSQGQDLGVTLLGGLSQANGVFTAAVDSVSVVGQGPGPIHINFQAAAGVLLDDGEGGSLKVSGFEFDVGTSNFTADIAYTVPFVCDATGDVACPALASRTFEFNDLTLLKALSITGNIDGGTPLDQALAVPTLVPQKVSLVAQLGLDLTAFQQLATQLNVALPAGDANLGNLPIATLTVSAVPEASTTAYMLLGLACVGALARRRASV